MNIERITDLVADIDRATYLGERAAMERDQLKIENAKLQAVAEAAEAFVMAHEAIDKASEPPITEPLVPLFNAKAEAAERMIAALRDAGYLKEMP